MSAAVSGLLSGPRVGLRLMRADDVAALYELYADPVGMRYWSFPPLTGIDQAREQFERNQRGLAAGECMPWVIVPHGAERMIGTCSLFAIDARHRRAMVGYALARAHWGSGLATEALRLALAHAFGAMRLHRLEADIDPRNLASVRLIERVGFAREGLQRERWIVGDDIQDSALYGLLARDWAAQGAEASRPG
jgi:RimJ/RimL family protein N-acetyltransferase